MGQKPSTARKDGFVDIVPGFASAKRPTTTRDGRPASPAAARPAETAVPAIPTPPHALATSDPPSTTRRPTTTDRQRPETARRGGGSEHEDAAFAVPESVRKSQALAQFEKVCSEILPGFLYVSSLQVAQDRATLTNMGVTHVVNCCKEVACVPVVDGDRVVYLQLAVRDGVQEDLLPFFPLVVEFLETCKQRGGRALVHCHQGVSRSCAVAVAYVMRDQRCGFHEAIALVKKRRAICSPNAAFICQLLEWERELALASSPALHSASHGLYRLAPHAAYDASTLLLKLCYHRESRRKVVVETSEASPLPSPWLWGRGVFVFVDHTEQIVVWRGAACTIADGVGEATRQLHRMLRVLAGDAAASETRIVTITEERSGESDASVDRFGYSTELAWQAVATSSQADATAAIEVPSAGGQHSAHDATVPTPKPQLFLLENAEGFAWERLTEYDSDDLQSSVVLLLVAVGVAYLWVGRERARSPVDPLRSPSLDKARHVRGAPISSLSVEHQDCESDGFWDAFEAGY